MKGCFVQEQVIVLKYKCGFLTDRRDIFFADVVERIFFPVKNQAAACLLYTSDAADEL